VRLWLSRRWRRSTTDGTSALIRKKFNPWWSWLTRTSCSSTRSSLRRTHCTLFLSTWILMSISSWKNERNCSRKVWFVTSCFSHYKVSLTCTSRITCTETWNLKICFVIMRRSRLRISGKFTYSFNNFLQTCKRDWRPSSIYRLRKHQVVQSTRNSVKGSWL
jgi:hypothetical protein